MGSESKRQEGFYICDDSKVSQDLRKEIAYYNDLILTYDDSEQQKLALIQSEDRICEMLSATPGLYPHAVMYGHLELISMIHKKPPNTEKCTEMLVDLKTQFGNDHLLKLCLFNPLDNVPTKYKILPLLGWGHGRVNRIDLNDTPCNLFMLAILSGDVKLADAILNLVDDKKIKKNLLLQFMQFDDADGKLIHQSMLTLAIKSGSNEMLNYILKTCLSLDILSDMAKSTTMMSQNSLQDAILGNQIDMVKTILSYQKYLGRILFVKPSQKIPIYMRENLGYMPAFLYAVFTKNPQIFNEVMNHTIESTKISDPNNFFEKQYKLSALAHALGTVELNSYVKHTDFDTKIFERLLTEKIHCDAMLKTLSYSQRKFSNETGISLNTDLNQVNISVELLRIALWRKDHQHVDPIAEHSALQNKFIFEKLYQSAMRVKNFNAACVVLKLAFENDCQELCTQLITNATPMHRSVFVNYLLQTATLEQNATLMQTLFDFKFTLKNDVFKTLLSIEDPNHFLFSTRELLHHMQRTNMAIESSKTIAILKKIRDIQKQDKSHQFKTNLKIAVKAVKAVKDAKIQAESTSLFASNKVNTAIQILLDEIESNKVPSPTTTNPQQKS